MMNGIQFQSVQTSNAFSSELRSVIRDNALQFYVQSKAIPTPNTSLAKSTALVRVFLRTSKQVYVLSGDEPLKITISAKAYGYLGTELAEILGRHNMVCEFADPDDLVLMLSPEIGADGLTALQSVLLSIPKGTPISVQPPVFRPGQRVCSPREAMLSPMETVPVEESRQVTI